MIALLACFAVATTPKVVEVVDPASNRIAVQIVVKLPELDARELGMARVLEAVLTDGTTEFSRLQLVRTTGLVGSPIRCRLMPDTLRVQYSLPAGALDTAGLLADSICERASLSADSLTGCLGVLPYRYQGYWSEALDSRVPVYDRIRLTDLREFYRHLFRPENICIGVAGKFEKGEAEAQFAKSFAAWTPSRDTYPRYHFTDFAKWQTTRKRQIATIELYSEVMPSDLGKNALMASVLGLGKGSLAFRIVREKLLLSYRQEAFLWPSESGIQLRLIAAVSDMKQAQGAGKAMREALLEGVESLDASDLERAKAILGSAWTEGLIGGPLCFDDGRPVGGSVEDQALLAAYGQLKTGAPWSLATILRMADDVPLESLKQSLKTIIENAQTRTILPN